MTSPATLIVAFRRPQHVERLLRRLSVGPPSKMVVAIDGPQNSDDHSARVRIMDLLERLPWNAEIDVWLQEKNLGLRRHMTSSITRFLAENSCGVILEEDCLPSPTFLAYSAQALERYRYDRRVSMISGNRFGPQRASSTVEVLSRHHHIWGWATWEERWAEHAGVLDGWATMGGTVLSRTFPTAPCAQEFWRRRIDEVLANNENSWAYRWTAANWVLDRYAVLPPRNLVVNQGISPGSATHTRSINAYIRKTPLCHWSGYEGSYASTDLGLDEEINRRVFGVCPSHQQELVRKLRRGVTYGVGPLRRHLERSRRP